MKVTSRRVKKYQTYLFSKYWWFFRNALTPFRLLTPEMRVCSSRQLPVYTVAEQQNRSSRCPSSSWVSSCAFHPQLKERPKIIGAVLEWSRCESHRGSSKGWMGFGVGWNTDWSVNIQMSLVLIYCNQGCCRELHMPFTAWEHLTVGVSGAVKLPGLGS